MITIQQESSYLGMLEGMVLAANHYKEVESKSEHIPFNPNLDTFKALLDAGMLRLVTARDDTDNKMVGYFMMLVTDDLLTGNPSAQELGIFVSKKYRGGSTFVRMEKEMSRILKEEGFKEMRIMFKTGHNTSIPTRMGYEETERVYQKFL
ncbi:acyl-CoA N-acyltransferase [Vibrio phage 1.293.O._10N.261.52.E1]|nr:acyl-CoA N-acyltransferase [Vibrio phage 1.293.O._10N.261.52.E1]